jgi:hypothetical protein
LTIPDDSIVNSFSLLKDLGWMTMYFSGGAWWAMILMVAPSLPDQGNGKGKLISSNSNGTKHCEDGCAGWSQACGGGGGSSSAGDGGGGGGGGGGDDDDDALLDVTGTEKKEAKHTYRMRLVNITLF